MIATLCRSLLPMVMTIAEVLALDVVVAGRPETLSGGGQLDVPLRWVHVSDLPEVGELLTGGELVLTTGMAMATSPAAAVRFVDQLVAAGAAGLVVELGPAVRAWAIYPGGQSGNPASARYDDRITRWLAGDLDSVLFPSRAEELPAHRVRARLTLRPAR